MSAMENDPEPLDPPEIHEGKMASAVQERAGFLRLIQELGRHPGYTIGLENIEGELVIAVWLRVGDDGEPAPGDFPWHVHVDEDMPLGEALNIAAVYLERL